MIQLPDIDVEQYLNEVYNKIIQYECKFSDDLYEICVLVSKGGVSLLEGHGGFVYVQKDPFCCDHYLYGHRIIFINNDYIPDFNRYYHVIRPVIVCKERYMFPTEADVGDFVIYDNTLRQISDVSIISGNKTVSISDICVRLSNSFDPTGYHQALDRIMEYSRKRIDVRVEDWVENPDTSAITNYFNSLATT